MVWRNLSNKEKAYTTLIIFLAISIAFWFYGDDFSNWASNNNPWLVMVVSIILNPAYAFLIYALYREYEFRGVLAGLLISIALDIVSLPHSISKIGILPSAGPLHAYTDTLFYKILGTNFPGAVGTFMLHVILPSLIVYLALRIIRRTSSFNHILKEAI
jgi:hypothetical protein